MFAIVDAEMSISRSAPRCSRPGDSGSLDSVNGTCGASLMRSSPSRGLCQRARPGRCWYVFSTDHARVTVNSQQLRSPPLASAFQFVRNVPDQSEGAQGPERRMLCAVPTGAGLAGGRVRAGALAQDDLAG